MAAEKANITDFENSYKINENSYNDNFFVVVIKNEDIYISEKKFVGGGWGLVALYLKRA